MLQNFYDTFIKPSSKGSESAEREIVLNYLLLGMLGLALVALADTSLEFIFYHDHYLVARLLGITLTSICIVLLYVLSRYTKQQRAVSLLLVTIVVAVASVLVYRWGLQVPTAILLFSLAIVMAGILVNAQCSLYAAGVIILILATLQYAQANGHVHPDLTWIRTNSTAGDIIGFSAIFLIIALVSWLFNRQMEASLKRARRSESALKRQKALLEIRVEKRTRELEVAQLEKMQELYRFAELGKLSTALFHDLANHVSTVSLDIEGLKNKDESTITQRIHENVGHIDAVVRRVRQQIQGKSTAELFNVTNEIEEVIKILSFTARQRSVDIQLQPGTVRRQLLYNGDIVRFRQILLNLISNAIDAYSALRSESQERVIIIGLNRVRTRLDISVTDHGIGIPPADQTKIFEPFYTSKEKGIGIGLFIVKQVVENDFKGSLRVTSNPAEGTIFTASLPKSYYA